MSLARSSLAREISRSTNWTSGDASLGGGHRFRGQLLERILDVDHRGPDGLLQVGVGVTHPIDGLHDLGRRGHDRPNGSPDDPAEVVEGQDVGRVGHGHEDLAVTAVDRQPPVPAAHGLWHLLGQLQVDRALLQVDELQAELLGQGPDELGGGHQAAVEQDLAQLAARAPLLAEGGLDLVIGQHPGIDEDLTKASPGRS